MTTPAERTRAVVDTRAFLLQLCARDDVPVDVHRHAERLLRHYPHGGDLDIVSAALPMFWGPGTDSTALADAPSYPELLGRHHTVRVEPPGANRLISAVLNNEDRSRTVLAGMAVVGTLIALAAAGYANIFLR